MRVPSTYSIKIKRFFITALAALIAATGIAQDIGERMRDNLFLYYGENADEKIKNNILCTARVNRSEVFAGEPVIVTYKLYTALQSFSSVEKMPSFNGFSVYEIKDPKDPVTEMVNGKWYSAYTIRAMQLYPGEAGTFTLDPAVIKNTVIFQQSALNNSGHATLPEGYLPEDDIPGFTKKQYEYRIISGSPVIHVSPLPEQGRPATYSGAVGKFNIAAVCRESEVEKNGAVKVVYTLTGTGNFKMINELPIQRSPAFETFDPVISEELNERVAPFSGKKTFEYTFSPVQEGKAAIPPVQFSYFDPATHSFHTLTANGVNINVVPARKRDTPVQQVTPIAATGAETENYTWYIVIGVAVLLGGFLLWLRQKKNKPVIPEPVAEIEEDEEFWKREEKFFQQSAKMIDDPDTVAFYTVLNRELQMAMMRLLNLPTGTSGIIYESLLARDEQLAATYQKLVQDLNRFTYAYATPEYAPGWYYEEAKKIADIIKG